MPGNAYDRTISIFGEVDYLMSAEIVGCLGKIKNLTAYLMTDGGDYSHALAIYDEIRKIPNSTVIATGIVASAGLTILQAFKNRTARINTQFMVHNGGFEVDPGVDKQELEIRFGKHLNDLQFDMLAKRMGVSNARIAFGEGIFDACRAVKLNLIDSIVE